MKSTIIAIDSVVDRGSSNRAHRVELYGTFPVKLTGQCALTSWQYQHAASCYAVDVICNGALIRSSIEYYSRRQLNVELDERPTGSACSFKAKEQDGVDAAVYSNEQWLGAPASPSTLSPPPIETLATNDRGRSAGVHTYELYGYFPATSWNQFTTNVVCDGVTRSASVSGGLTPGQINISFADSISNPNGSGKAASCTFELRRTTDGQWTPRWAESVNNSRAALPASFGAYYWGGVQPGANQASDVARYGTRFLRQAGIQGPIRLTLSPDQLAVAPTSHYYNANLSSCNGRPFLPCAANQPVLKNAFTEAGAGAPSFSRRWTALRSII